MKGITLIGMPGSGKSTIGKALARTLRKEFIDLDLLIKKTAGKSHKSVLLENGDEAFLLIEEKIVMGLSLQNKVFAPSGSIIYCDKAMIKIKNETFVIYLKVEKETLKKRLGKLSHGRGIVGLEKHGFDKLFEIRADLYEKYADTKIDIKNQSREDVSQQILQLLSM